MKNPARGHKVENTIRKGKTYDVLSIQKQKGKGAKILGKRCEFAEESLHMRIDSDTVVGVQELASGFIRKGFSFMFPRDCLVHHCDLESLANLPRPMLS